MEREILHVDVNNAFLSWLAVYKLECGEKLDIRTIPSIIGGDEKQRHGIVLAKSNLAKQFGIKTGEPLYSARKKCPTIKIYESNFKVYRKYSDMLYKLLLEYSYKVERFSIDECFVDMTEFLNGRRLIDVAYEISKRVKEELKFTVNIGVAHNKLLAKMASDFQKPDRVHTLYEKEIPRKMWTLPISELFMVGRRTLPKLYNMNIKTIEDLAKVDKNLLIKKFGKFGKTMWEYANGIDESEVVYTYQKPKCVGNSTTVSQDINDIEKIEELNKFLYNFGLKIRIVNEKIYPKEVSKILEEIKGKEEEKVVSTLILRTLKIARYEAENKGHFGIASKYYCHFTSPIRRYPDLFIHRIISKYLEENYVVSDKFIEDFKQKAIDRARMSSEREKVATKAERDSEDMKKAEFMQDKIGQEYEGIVSSVTQFGIFVELENTVEGLIRFENLGNEYFIYDEDRKRLIGENSNKVYKIGDKVKIRVISANKLLRQIDFEIVEA